jgi:hypothetical protein
VDDSICWEEGAKQALGSLEDQLKLPADNEDVPFGFSAKLEGIM